MENTLSFLGRSPQQSDPCLARAIAADLRRRHPHKTLANVAADLGCTGKAAENLLDGHLSARNLGWLIRAYGAGWLAERSLEAAGLTLETYVENQVAAAERAATKARERAEEARRLYATYQASRRRDPGDHRTAA